MAISDLERQAILTLHKNGVMSQDIVTQVGVSPGTVAAVKAAYAKGAYSEISEGGDPEILLASAADTAFGLERDLQMALRRNIEQLETGLTIVDSDREQTVASGRIDITARDPAGVIVVIELKVGAADRDAIAQLLAYMGDLMNEDTSVRGILVAREFAPRAISAARVVPNVRLVKYGFQFKFEAVTGSNARGLAAAPQP